MERNSSGIAKLLYEQLHLLIEKSKDAEPAEIRENINLLYTLYSSETPLITEQGLSEAVKSSVRAAANM